MSDEIEIMAPRDVLARRNGWWPTKHAPGECDECDRDREQGLIQADESLAALTEAGYAIVPREPTDAMRAAAPVLNDPNDVGSVDVWRIMIAECVRTAMPSPPDSPIPGKATDAAKTAQGAPAATGGDSSDG